MDNVDEIFDGWYVLASTVGPDCWASIKTLIGVLHGYTDMVDEIRNQMSVGGIGKLDQLSRSKRSTLSGASSVMMTISWSNYSSTVVLTQGIMKGDNYLLSYAASKGRDPIVQQLVSKGTNGEAKDTFGKHRLRSGNPTRGRF